MPPWKIHIKYASIMDVPIEVAEKVNFIADCIIHDFGKIIGEDSLDFFFSKIDEGEYKRRRAKEWELLSANYYLRVTPKAKETFYLHHALDFYSEIIVNELLTNYEIAYEDVLDIIKQDLEKLSKNIGGSNIKACDGFVGNANRIIVGVLSFMKDEKNAITTDIELKRYCKALAKQRKNEKEDKFNRLFSGRPVLVFPVNMKATTINKYTIKAIRAHGGKPTNSMKERMASACSRAQREGMIRRSVIETLLERYNIYEWIRLKLKVDFEKAKAYYSDAYKTFKRCIKFGLSPEEEWILLRRLDLPKQILKSLIIDIQRLREED
jgi:hypothetical protein